MAFEEVLSDRDSEDEVDDDVADFEDRRVICNNLLLCACTTVEYKQCATL